jgi:hypothetical protein
MRTARRVCRIVVLASGEGHRFDLRFLRAFRVDLSIKKSSSLFPPLIAATSQRGFAPRPAQVSPSGPRYFGGTFVPFNALPPLATFATSATTPSILANCRSMSARRLRSVSSTCFRRSIRASTVILDRFAFGIVISSPRTVRYSLRGFREQSKLSYLCGAPGPLSVGEECRCFACCCHGFNEQIFGAV